MSAPLSKEKKALVLAMLSEGTAINAVCRVLHVGVVQVLRLILDAGAAAREWHTEHVRNLTCEYIAADEVWSYIGEHEARLPKGNVKDKENWRGDCWLLSSSCSVSKLVIAWRSGERTEETVSHLFSDVLDCVPGRFQLTTDCFGTFIKLMRKLPERVSCATELKVFGGASDPGSFKKVNRLLGCERRPIKGTPEMSKATTAFQERLHLTFRQQMRRFGRRTIGYSKTYAHHTAAISLFIFIYNWCRRSEAKALNGQTPAMAAGLADKPFSLERLVEITEAYLKKQEAAKWEAAFAEKYNH